MREKFKSCCFTGYRPSKFPFSIEDGGKLYVELENKLTDAVFSMPGEQCYTFYSGMAMGFDIIAAETVLLLREAYRIASIELICALPFIDQSAAYDDLWRRRYESVLAAADEVILVSDKYYPGCYQRRNEFMVNNSDYVLTWYDGRQGGTRNTLAYAAGHNKKIINLHDYGVHEHIWLGEVYELLEDEEPPYYL